MFVTSLAQGLIVESFLPKWCLELLPGKGISSDYSLWNKPIICANILHEHRKWFWLCTFLHVHRSKVRAEGHLAYIKEWKIKSKWRMYLRGKEKAQGSKYDTSCNETCCETSSSVIAGPSFHKLISDSFPLVANLETYAQDPPTLQYRLLCFWS